MKIGIIGSGIVGQTLGEGLLNLGYDVMIGTREVSKLDDWKKKNSGQAGSFEDAAKFGDVIFIATLWLGTENAIKLSGSENFRNKIMVDVTNPIDFSHGKPDLATKYPISAGEQIKKWTGANVAKAFNTVPAHIMTNPQQLGDADLFIAGDEEAKGFVRDLAKKFGWHDVIDMGGINSAWWVEMIAMSVINYGFSYNDWNFALRFYRSKQAKSI